MSRVPIGVQVVSFDLWKTLIRASRSYLDARTPIFANGVHWDGDPQVFGNAIGQASTELDKLMDQTGECHNFAPRINRACDIVSIPHISDEEMRALDEAIKQCHRANPPTLTEEDLVGTFAALWAQGYQIAIMSNTGITTGGTMRALLTDLGLGSFIEHWIFSDELGHAKPSKEIFAYLLELSGTKPEAALHIGDNIVADYQGATDFGLHGLWYTTKEQGDHTIAELRQLV